MKRFLVLTLVLALMVAMAAPGVAFAKRGVSPTGEHSKGKSEAASEAPKAPDADEAEEADDADEAPEADEADDDSDEAVEADDDADGTDEAVEAETAATEEAPKLTGTANALSRLQANLARKQAALESGKVKGLPEGLQTVIAKFMSWLGIPSEPAAVPPLTSDAPATTP